MTVQRTVLIDTCNAMINRDVTSDYSANLREVAKIALAALTVGDVANREAQPVSNECDYDVYANGKSACIVVIPKEAAEVICRGISEVTGCKVDWHYIGGRVHIKALTAPPAMERQHECVSRKVFPWVEGRVIPAWVRDLASGPQGCENTFIIAELDADKQSQGWPQFIAAYIDMRLNRYICGNTAENVSDHVLRYLPFDHCEVETHHAE